MRGIDSILLIALSLPWPLKYRIFPMEGTPYILFGVYFALLFAHIAIDLGWIRGSKLAIVVAVVAVAAGGPLITAIVDRSRVAPVFGVHDIILQLEAAMRYLINGVNPYAATYFDTHMESFRYDELGKAAINPALYHFVMPPWYLLFPFFFYPFLWIFGFFDGRLPLLFTYFGTLAIFALWVKDSHKKIPALIMVAFNPVMFDYLIEGRSDHFAFFWFIFALFLYERKKYVLAAVMYALALLSKQTIWLSLPFVLLFAKTKKPLAIVGFLIILASVLGPFLLWDAQAYWQSTIAFLQGATPLSYPVAGYGWGMILYQLGVIKDIHAYYPFVYWQAAVGIPFVWFLLKWLRANRSVGRLLIAYGLFLFVFWYFSRYFHNSHLGYISLVLTAGYFLEES